jgi:hypothetical protein
MAGDLSFAGYIEPATRIDAASIDLSMLGTERVEYLAYCSFV